MYILEPLQQFFDELSRDWDKRQPDGRERTLYRLMAHFDALLCKDSCILEAGCGTGALLPVLRQRYMNASLAAVDLSLQMLQQMNGRRQGATLAQADVHFLPFEDHCFSSVICHDSFPHFQQKHNALAEFKRVLMEDGRLFILHDISRERVNAVHRRSHDTIIHHDMLPDVHMLSQMLQESGFELVFTRDDANCFVMVAVVI